MTADQSPESLSVVVFSSDFDRVHYALVMASAGAATGMPATLFFTMGACRALLRPGPDGVPPWRAMTTTEGGMNGGEQDDFFRDQGVASFEELLAACVEMDVRFIVCEMGLRALGVNQDALRDDIPMDFAGVVTFLRDASNDGAMVFV